jgi:hypothetical protein
MMITKVSLPRRTFLRGVGATLALPFLDAMIPALSASAKPIMRLGFFYIPNGASMNFWRPTGVGTEMEISPTLTPLAPFRDQMTVITRLANHQAEIGNGGAAHTRCQSLFLSGIRPKETEGADIEAGKTIDQYAADKLGVETPLRSLELALDLDYLTGNCDFGYSCAYVNTFSWRSPTQPLPMENNPRVVFERLFGDGGVATDRVARIRGKRSILDMVTDDMARLQRKLGPGDHATVTDYLDAVRDIEQRLQKVMARQMDSPVGDQPVGIPESNLEHAKLMMDLQLMAYQSDMTRVVAFQIAREKSSRTYPEIGVPQAHHDISHHGGDPARVAGNAKINTYQVGLFAHLVERMRATPDGDGTLLDHSMLLYGGGMGDGDLHSPHDLPIVLMGGGCGQLKGGRHIQAKLDTPLMNLGLSLLDKVGVELDSLGDSTGRLADL